MKIKIVLFIMVVALMLGGCGDYVQAPRDASKPAFDTGRFITRGDNIDDVQILDDTETGCQYLIYYKTGNINGITVLLDKEGNPVGCGK